MARILIGNIKGPQGAQGIQGPQGPVGATGPQGPMPDLINNALATSAGVAALDAAMGKTLQDQITQLNSDMNSRISARTKINLLQTNASTKIKITFSSNAGIAFLFGRNSTNKTVCMTLTCSSVNSLGESGTCSFSDMVATISTGSYFMGIIVYVPEWVSGIEFVD